jgi:hypothetical protein
MLKKGSDEVSDRNFLHYCSFADLRQEETWEEEGTTVVVEEWLISRQKKHLRFQLAVTMKQYLVRRHLHSFDSWSII